MPAQAWLSRCLAELRSGLAKRKQREGPITLRRPWKRGDRYTRQLLRDSPLGAPDDDHRFTLLLALYDIERTDEQNSASLLATVTSIYLTYIAGASLVLRSKTATSLPLLLQLVLPIVAIGLFAFLVMTLVGISVRGSYIRAIEQELSSLCKTEVGQDLEYPYLYRLARELYYPSKRLRWLPLLVTSHIAFFVTFGSLFAFILLTFVSVTGFARWIVCSVYLVLAVMECATYFVSERGDFFSDLRRYVADKSRNESV